LSPYQRFDLIAKDVQTLYCVPSTHGELGDTLGPPPIEGEPWPLRMERVDAEGVVRAASRSYENPRQRAERRECERSQAERLWGKLPPSSIPMMFLYVFAHIGGVFFVHRSGEDDLKRACGEVTSGWFSKTNCLYVSALANAAVQVLFALFARFVAGRGGTDLNHIATQCACMWHMVLSPAIMFLALLFLLVSVVASIISCGGVGTTFLWWYAVASAVIGGRIFAARMGMYNEEWAD
jgi:hypothetical protein